MRRTSGSEGGPGKRAGGDTSTAPRADPYVQLDDAGLNLVPDEPRRVPRFHCRSCRRDVPVRMERLELLARKLAERGVDRLDISALSAICYPGKQ